MLTCLKTFGAVTALWLASWSAALAGTVLHDVTTVNNVRVDRYRWADSHGLQRSVSLKQEGNGNPGHGGYAVQMTYQIRNGNGTIATIRANAPADSDGGFGYFVSHERYRDFTDNTNDTIASKIFNTDDSPLGRGFPVVGQVLTPADPAAAAHRFTMTYHHYGTVQPITKDADGNDVKPTPTNPAALKLYQMPITITWVFKSGTDYPRIITKIDLSGIGKPDLVNFDIRGPYGVLTFDNNADGLVQKVMWGDRFHFVTKTQPATRNSAWTWSGANTGARYTALIAGGYEMGLFEPVPFARSALADGYADERGKTSTTFNNGNGCLYETQIIPCDWEWPYQSLQYSLPYVSQSDPNANNEPTTGKKIAWGSSAFYGTGTSLTQVFDTPNTSEPLRGFPASKAITYSICVVLGRTTAQGLTKTAANTTANTYNCALSTP